jgi:hypothetical protein
MQEKLYSIGEIYRLGLLKSHTGEPYKDIGNISKIAKQLGTTKKKTAWGNAKCLTIKQINAYNKKRIIGEEILETPDIVNKA